MKITFKLSEREVQLVKMSASEIFNDENFDKFSGIMDESKDKEIVLTSEDLCKDTRKDKILFLCMLAVYKIAKDKNIQKYGLCRWR